MDNNDKLLSELTGSITSDINISNNNNNNIVDDNKKRRYFIVKTKNTASLSISFRENIWAVPVRKHPPHIHESINEILEV